MLVEADSMAPGLVRPALDMAVPGHGRACWVLPFEEVFRRQATLLAQYYRPSGFD